MDSIKITRYRSPVGEMMLGSWGDRLCICDWAVEKRRGTIDRRIRRCLHAEYEEGISEAILNTIAQLNEYSIFVPCHRVIGSNHTFTGYGGGLEAKQRLLDLEARTIGSQLPLEQHA